MEQVHETDASDKTCYCGLSRRCAALFSFTWSKQRGVSLSVETAQAQVGRPLTPMSVAGVARRQNRRAAYAYGAGVVGAGVAGAAALGTAAAVAATSPNWGWRGGPYYTGTGYSTGGAWGANAYYAPSAAGPSNGWYITGDGMACTSGTLVAGANGLPFRCP
jgi:hypothetical protein